MRQNKIHTDDVKTNNLGNFLNAAVSLPAQIASGLHHFRQSSRIFSAAKKCLAIY